MKAPTIEQVINNTAEYFGVPNATIATTGYRAKDALVKRQIAMYVAAKVTYKSLRQIAEEFGMDYAGSVSHARNKTEKLIEHNAEVANDVKEIIKSLNTEESENVSEKLPDTN